ncbi:MAG: glycine cleavage system protein GcvH [Candidatus Thermoplasmatota archaeon]
MTHEVRDDLKYTDTHEWVKVKGKTIRVGITDHAQSQLTDIVYVELPEVGKKVKKGEELCVVESVKSVSDVYAPVAGKVINVNKKIEDNPEIINSSPYDEGWLVELEVADPSEIDQLMDSVSYKKIT